MEGRERLIITTSHRPPCTDHLDALNTHRCCNHQRHIPGGPSAIAVDPLVAGPILPEDFRSKRALAKELSTDNYYLEQAPATLPGLVPWPHAFLCPVCLFLFRCSPQAALGFFFLFLLLIRWNIRNPRPRSGYDGTTGLFIQELQRTVGNAKVRTRREEKRRLP